MVHIPDIMRHPHGGLGHNQNINISALKGIKIVVDRLLRWPHNPHLLVVCDLVPSSVTQDL